jgi:ribosomal protein S18 acetylase RimI-like enzyme
MPLRVRDILESDAESVVSLWHAAGVTRPWNDPHRDIAFAMGANQASILVAEADEVLVGTVMVGEDGHRGWVYYVAADPHYRRQGVGRALMVAAEQWLQHRGIWKLNLLVRSDNVDVVGFYQRLGYADTGTICLQKVLES